MGNFRASLSIGGKEFDVLYSDDVFSGEANKKGKPASNPHGLFYNWQAVLEQTIMFVIKMAFSSIQSKGNMYFERVQPYAEVVV